MNVPLASVGLFLALSLTHQAPTKNFSGLHPALQVDGAKAAQLFDKGYHDGDVFKKLDAPANLFVATSRSSWMRLYPLQYESYLEGYQAKKAFVTQEELKAKRDRFAAMPPMDSFEVFGDVLASPSDTSIRTTDDGKREHLLTDVRVVLKVGDRVYQPRTQPGDLVGTFKEESYSTTVNDTKEVETEVKDQWGRVIGKVKSEVPESHTDHYYDAWVVARYSATFDLFDPDGTPRIRPDDKEIQAVVIWQDVQKKFNFKLNNLDKLMELKPRKGTFTDHFKIG